MPYRNTIFNQSTRAFSYGSFLNQSEVSQHQAWYTIINGHKGPIIRAKFFFNFSLSTLLNCRLKPFVACITTLVTNLSRSKMLHVDRDNMFLQKFLFSSSYYHWSYNLYRNKFKFDACDWLSRSSATRQIRKHGGWTRRAWIQSRPVPLRKSSICPVQTPRGLS